VVLPFKNAGFGEFQTYLQAGRPDEFLKKVAQNVVLRFFPNSKLQNAKFPTVTLPNFKSSNE
jgi:hypothetical protein